MWLSSSDKLLHLELITYCEKIHLYWFVGFIVCLAYRWCYSSCRGHWGMFFLSWLADCFPPKAVFSNNFCGGFSGQGFCFSLWELGSYCLVHRPVTRCNINNTAGKIRSVLFMSCEESQLGLCFIWKAAFRAATDPTPSFVLPDLHFPEQVFG